MTAMTNESTKLAIDERVARARQFFETLSPTSLNAIGEVYSLQARFIDPFNDVQGLPKIRHVFAHMFTQLAAPRFEVTQTITEGEQCFLVWNFYFKRKGQGQEMSVHGTSHLCFDSQGLVEWHRDYWDVSRELYESLPLLGGILRWLRGKLSAT
jgi:hypothetical protein